MITHQTIKWPFPTITTNQIPYYLSIETQRMINCQPKSIANRINLLLATFIVRVKKKSYNTKFDHSELQLIDVYPPKIDIAHLEINQLNPSLINIFIRFFNANTDSMHEKIIIGKTLAQKKNTIFSICTEFHDSFIKEFSFVEHENLKAISIYYINLYFFMFQNFDFDLSLILKLDHSYQQQKRNDVNSKIEKKITLFYASFLSRKNLSNSFKKNVELGISLLVCIYRIYSSSSIKIYVQYAKEIIGHFMIQNELKRTFSSSAINFVSNSSKADIVISDCIECENEANEHFFLEDIHDISIWKSLITRIQEKIFESKFQSY